MKIRTFVSIMLFMALYTLNAQIETLAEIQVNGTGKAIFTHEYSGIPIIKATKSYTAFNPETHEKIWEIERTPSTAAMESAGNGPADYVDFYNTPFAYLNGTLINVQSGQVLVDGEKDEIKRFMEYYIIPDADLVLVQLGAKNNIRLYGLNPFTSELKWGVNLREAGAIGQAVAGASSSIIPPLLTAGGDLLYQNGKNLASINLKKGSLNWNEKLNPGYIFINDDATNLLVAEKRGGLGSVMTVPGVSAIKFSKKMYLIDANTGKSLWSKGDTKMDGNIKFIMPYEAGYIVVHDEGFNIYDYSPGKQAEGKWKKDVSIKNISDIVIDEKGLMVYFKNRRMLIDPSNGDELWKKEEKLEKERKPYAMTPKASYNEIGDVSYYTSSGRIHVSVNGKTRSYSCEGFALNEEKMELVTYVTEWAEVQGIRAVIGFFVRNIDLNTGNSEKKRFNVRKGIDAVDVVENGYFFYNDRGFALLDYTNGEWGNLRKEYYPDPSRGERLLKGLAVAAIGITASTQNLGNAVVSNDPNAAAKFQAKQDALNNVDASELYTRNKVGRVETEFAYFFSRNDDGKLVLFKVEKNTGKEVKQYPFDDNSPIYEIDSWNDQLYYLVDDKLKIFAL